MRDDATRSCGSSTSRKRSTTSASAPRSAARPAKSWPSARKPGTQKCRAPGSTASASYVSDVMAPDALPRTSSGPIAGIRFDSSNGTRTLVDRAVGRDRQVLGQEARDLLEGRRGDDAAEDVRTRGIDDDHHLDARVIRRQEADERGDVVAGRVPEAVRQRLL